MLILDIIVLLCLMKNILMKIKQMNISLSPGEQQRVQQSHFSPLEEISSMNPAQLKFPCFASSDCDISHEVAPQHSSVNPLEESTYVANPSEDSGGCHGNKCHDKRFHDYVNIVYCEIQRYNASLSSSRRGNEYMLGSVKASPGYRHGNKRRPHHGPKKSSTRTTYHDYGFLDDMLPNNGCHSDVIERQRPAPYFPPRCPPHAHITCATDDQLGCYDNQGNSLDQFDSMVGDTGSAVFGSNILCDASYTLPTVSNDIDPQFPGSPEPSTGSMSGRSPEPSTGIMSGHGSAYENGFDASHLTTASFDSHSSADEISLSMSDSCYEGYSDEDEC